MKELQYLNKYLHKYRGRLLLGLITTVIAAVFKLAVPMKVGDSITIVEQKINGKITDFSSVEHELLINIILLFGATLLAAVFTFVMRQTIIVVSRKVEFDLKNEVYQHYQKLSLGFYKQNRTGDLMNRISEDVGKVRMYIGPAIMYSTSTITLFVVVISYMFLSDPELTLYAIAPLPVLSIMIYKLSIAIHKRSTVVQEYLSKLTTFTQESFSGIGVIKAYGIEPSTTQEFESLSQASKEKNINLTKVQALFFPLMMLLIGASNILVIYIGGSKFITGEIQDFGTIVSFLIYVNMLTWPVAIVGWVTSMIQQAEASQKRINEFLKTEPAIVNTSKIATPIKGSIAFKNLSFTYDDTNIQALKNISFTIQPGETIAILGNTGSGKSTILELIARLYDTEPKTLFIDNTPIKDLNLQSLRSSIGFVFTKGYQTILGERGITLSGGQKQRVSIARALIKDPAILLFDDCLSAVDTETEEEILSNLNHISQNKTTVIVSHRVSSAKNADKIIILEEGCIIQQGTHNKLVNIPGYYKELYLKQRTEKEI